MHQLLLQPFCNASPRNSDSTLCSVGATGCGNSCSNDCATYSVHCRCWVHSCNNCSNCCDVYSLCTDFYMNIITKTSQIYFFMPQKPARLETRWNLKKETNVLVYATATRLALIIIMQQMFTTTKVSDLKPLLKFHQYQEYTSTQYIHVRLNQHIIARFSEESFQSITSLALTTSPKQTKDKTKKAKHKMSERNQTAASVKDKNTHEHTKSQLVSWLVFYDTFSTNRLYHATEIIKISHRAGGQHKYHAVKQ